LYGIEELKHLCTSKVLNKSVCQARLNTSQPLWPAETYTRSWTPVWRLMPDYLTCQTSARLDYRDCAVLHTASVLQNGCAGLLPVLKCVHMKNRILKCRIWSLFYIAVSI
jgi:hypothetical protein